MSLETEIKDGGGTDQLAIVNGEGALNVAAQIKDTPPIGTANRHRYFNSVLGSTGADSGTTNMNVDGSVTTQKFFIEAHQEYDIRIMGVVIVIADQTINHNLFGSVSPLTNGWDLQIIEEGEAIKVIDTASTSGQVIAQSGFSHPYGTGLTSFQLTKWTANDDAHTIFIPIGGYVPEGLRIGRGTLDRIESVINDDLTGLTEFTVRVIGYRHYSIS